MATDKSEPKIKAIVVVGLLAVGTLIAVRTSLVSYFNMQVDNENHAKRGTSEPQQLKESREQEKVAMGKAKVSIDKAMETFAATGRTPDMMPQPSNDMAPVAQRWKEMPAPSGAPAAAPAMAPAPGGSSEHATQAADGGATPTVAADAAAPTTAATEAGVPVAADAAAAPAHMPGHAPHAPQAHPPEKH